MIEVLGTAVNWRHCVGVLFRIGGTLETFMCRRMATHTLWPTGQPAARCVHICLTAHFVHWS